MLSPVSRGAGRAARCPLRMLPPVPLPGRHLHHHDQAEDPVLLLQPDRPLHPDCLHGGAGLHTSAGLRGETVFR